MRGLGLVVALTCAATVAGQGSANKKSKSKLLSPPVPDKCTNRPKQFRYGGHSYFYTGNEKQYEDEKYNWLDGRNICREHCMDLVSLETEAENTFISNWLKNNDLPYTWTSGRLCDFKGCDRPDLQPLSVNGWFWTGSNKKLPPTNSTPSGWESQPWSHTGHTKAPQPDNAEFDINKSAESCLGLLNDIYSDGVRWHDIACYHKKAVLCEDSKTLLDYVKATNKGIRL